MAININKLKSQSDAVISIGPNTQKSKIIRVLVSHPKMAFKPKELAAQADIPATIAPVLCRKLVEDGLANTESNYYYLPQDDKIAAVVRQTLGDAHQRDMAQKTAEADSGILETEASKHESERLTDAEVAAELNEINDGVTDI